MDNQLAAVEEFFGIIFNIHRKFNLFSHDILLRTFVLMNVGRITIEDIYSTNLLIER